MGGVRTQQNVIRLAATDRTIGIHSSKLDRRPTLFSCANGTIDLETGMYRQASQEDLLTVGSGVVWDEKATCDGWLKFLGEVFEGDTALINYIQKLAGYWTTV